MNKKLFYKISLVILAVLAVSPWLFTDQASAKIQSYYSGDAINYNNQLLVATTNTGYLEIFKLAGKALQPLVKVKLYDPVYNDYKDYADVKLSAESGKLYVYAVSQYTVFKYDFSDLTNLTLSAADTNTYWNWYYRVDRFGANIGLIGKRGVDILNPNLQIIDSFVLTPTAAYSLRGSGDGQFFLDVSGGKIQIYDRLRRQITKEIPLNFSSAESNHKVYFDSINDAVYAIDDSDAKKFSGNGQLLASFHHRDAPGYDAESSDGDAYVYFSNGLGVMKMDKENFQVKDYAYTTALDGAGGWAMGLKLVNTKAGDRLVVFNAADILVLNDKLEALASVGATAEAPTP